VLWEWVQAHSSAISLGDIAPIWKSSCVLPPGIPVREHQPKHGSYIAVPWPDGSANERADVRPTSPTKPGTIRFTPEHGSWLNQAEIEIGLFSRQCLGNGEYRIWRPSAGRVGHGTVQ
jgi:hypothetical protein